MDLDNPFHTNLWHKFLVWPADKANFCTSLCYKIGIILFLFEGCWETISVLPLCRETELKISHLQNVASAPKFSQGKTPTSKLQSGADSYFRSVVNHQSPSLVLLTYFTHMKVTTESSKSRCCVTDYGDAEDICPTQWTGLGTDVSNFFKSRTCCPFFSNKQNFSSLSLSTKVLSLMHKICKFLKHHFAL